MPVFLTANVIVAEGSPNSTNRSVAIDDHPNICPICHFTITAEALAGTTPSAAFNWLEIYYRCSNKKCRRHFTGLFIYVSASREMPSASFYEFHSALPAEPEPVKVNEAVEKVSPDFIRIYQEAHTANALRLHEIAGPGYRKALEFLLKDYAISLHADDAEDIKKTPLAAVVKKYLPNDYQKIVASRAVWLGNDETHYERKWVGKGLEQLIKLIDATIHFIAMEKFASDLSADMPDA